MNDLINFDYHGNEVRTVTIDGDPWWVAKDVCLILGIDGENTKDSVAGLDDDEKAKISISSNRVNNLTRPVWCVNEPGLYSLILRSRKPEAKDFKRWITHEVLPRIRKTGTYQLSGERLIAVALVEAQKILEESKAQIAYMKPKADFYDAVAGSKDAVEMKHVAKLLDKGIGRNRLFEFLRESGVLMADNTPYQSYIDRRYFRVIEQKYTTPEGETRINMKTLVYQKGIEFIKRLLEKERQGLLAG